MKMIKGNLLDLAEAGEFTHIIHGCNCQGVMGSGIAAQIRERYPNVYKTYLQSFDVPEFELEPRDFLGKTSAAVADDLSLIVINANTQLTFGRDPNTRYVSYDAVDECFSTIKQALKRRKGKVKIGYPLIGCGLGGGNWEIISRIIDHQLKDFDHTLVIYDGDSNGSK